MMTAVMNRCRYCGCEFALLPTENVCVGCASAGTAGDDCMWRARRIMDRAKNPAQFYREAFNEAFHRLIAAHAEAMRHGRYSQARHLAHGLRRVDKLLTDCEAWTREHLMGNA